MKNLYYTLNIWGPNSLGLRGQAKHGQFTPNVPKGKHCTLLYLFGLNNFFQIGKIWYIGSQNLQNQQLGRHDDVHKIIKLMTGLVNIDQISQTSCQIKLHDNLSYNVIMDVQVGNG